MSKEPSLQHIVYKSNYPFSIYLLFLLPIICVLLSIIYKLNFFGLLTYLPVFIILFYVFFSRYSARVEINNAFVMKICYFFPWNKNVIVDLTTVKSFDYARGFYAPFDDKRLGYFGFLRRCYDLVMLFDYNRNFQSEFKVNFRLGSFKELINVLSKNAKIVLVKLKSTENIIW